jgi:vacuolar-type H+-ATPase subunit C/Vma6
LLLRRYPDADRVIAPAEHAPTELFALEAALLDGFARRASRAAARDRHLRTFVRDTLDVGNAITALVLAADPPDVDPAQLYVTGGQWLTKDTFVTAARAHDRAAASALVAAAFARSPLARVVSGAALQPGVIERTFLTMTLARLKRRARQEPLDTAVLLRVLLLIEAQVRDLRTLAWGATLGAPPSLRVHYLVTPP